MVAPDIAQSKQFWPNLHFSKVSGTTQSELHPLLSSLTQEGRPSSTMLQAGTGSTESRQVSCSSNSKKNIQAYVLANIWPLMLEKVAQGLSGGSLQDAQIKSESSTRSL